MYDAHGTVFTTLFRERGERGRIFIGRVEDRDGIKAAAAKAKQRLERDGYVFLGIARCGHNADGHGYHVDAFTPEGVEVRRVAKTTYVDEEVATPAKLVSLRVDGL